ncbi:MAG: radical SAM protein [Deltaproteobacteria bacterium]|jgi:radical SAM protein with 4Fe4S-binding SPASM domain|nr:radical SAM protein [Deltaproteobacteria bacterium]
MLRPKGGRGFPPEVFHDSRAVSKFLAEKDPTAILSAELGPKFDQYRHAWDLAKRNLAVPPFPLHVDYEIKSLCNLRCPMCPMALSPASPAPVPTTEAKDSEANPSLETKAGTKTPPPRQRLSRAEVEALIDEGVESGQASMGFGGLWEPLLCADLPALVAYGRRAGLVEAMFNTNGYHLTRRTSRELVEAGLTRLMVSLDAVDKKTYEQMRPGSDLDRVEENILVFLEERAKARSPLPLLRLSFCLTSLNERELPAFLERWSDKADFFSLQSYGRFSEDAPALFPSQTAQSPPPPGFCAQPFKRLLVRHDGQVLPCCDLSGLSLALGEARKGLAAVWNGEKLNELRAQLRSLSLPPACRACQSKYKPPA